MKSIVIIEDHPLMQKGLVSFFTETKRWKVLGTASSVDSAKELLTKVTPDVLLLDIQLKAGKDANGKADSMDAAGMDADSWGLDIIPWLEERLKKQSSTSLPSASMSDISKPPVLPLFAIYSAFDDYAHVSVALSLGVKAYVTKRRSEQELEAALLSALSGNVYIDEAAKIKLNNVTNVISLLTKREAEMLNLVKRGFSNKQIANDLGISIRTVENILSCVYDKTNIHSRLELERL